MARKKGFDPFKMKAKLRAFERGVQADLKAAVNITSNILAADIRIKAPVDTGELRGSVEVRPVRGGRKRIRQVVVVSGGRHERGTVASVEYGNYKRTPQPFIRPAISATLGRRKAIIERAAKAKGKG